MFFGMLNVRVLSQVLPFEGDLDSASQEAKVANLVSKSVALTCRGWSRVFASNHATIQQDEAGMIKTFGVYLTPAQGAMCDRFEGLGSYYDKLRVPVSLHGKD